MFPISEAHVRSGGVRELWVLGWSSVALRPQWWMHLIHVLSPSNWGGKGSAEGGGSCNTPGLRRWPSAVIPLWDGLSWGNPPCPRSSLGPCHIQSLINMGMEPLPSSKTKIITISKTLISFHIMSLSLYISRGGAWWDWDGMRLRNEHKHVDSISSGNPKRLAQQVLSLWPPWLSIW